MELIIIPKQLVYVPWILSDQRPLCKALIYRDVIHTSAVIGLSDTGEAFVGVNFDQHPGGWLKQDGRYRSNFHV